MDIAQFRIDGELARGGMGVVYRAFDQALGRPVAIKVVQVSLPELDEQLARFRQEAQACASLRHPHIVAVHSAGFAQGRPYLVMDLIEGESLARRLRDGPLDVDDALRIAEEVASALACAHAAGIVHRDVKPENVLLDREGRSLLADFGIAKALGRDTQVTLSGEVLGTPAYMAPEQARADPGIGPSADVFAWGGVLFAMLTGRAPVIGASVVEILQRVQRETPPAPGSLRPGVPPALDALCLDCLRKQPAERPELAQVLERLRACREGGDAAAPAPRRTLLAGGVLGLVALGGLAVAALGRPGTGPSDLGPGRERPSPTPRDPAATASLDPGRPEAGPEAGNPADYDRAAALEFLEQARFALRFDAPERAPALLNKAIAADPTLREAHLELLDMLGRNSAVEPVVEAASRALRQFPGDPAFYLRRAAALSVSGDPEGALADLDEALRINPDGATALANRSMLHFLREEPAGALRDARRLARVLPNTWLTHTTLAGACLIADDLPGCIAAATSAIAIDPGKHPPYRHRVQAYRRQKRLDLALRDLNHVLRHDPRALFFYLIRAQILSDGGLLSDAERDLQEALSLAPNHLGVQALRGELLFRRRRLGEALDALSRVLERDPKHTRSYFFRGMTLVAQGRHDLAIEDLDRYLAAPREGLHAGNAYLGRAVARSSLGRLAGAREDAAQALRLIDPRDVDSGRARRLLDQLDASLKPEDPAPSFPHPSPDLEDLIQRGSEARWNGDLRTSAQLLGQAHELAPENADVTLHLAVVLRLFGRPDAALPILARTLEYGPDPRLLCARGDLLVRLDRLEEARRALDEAIRVAPTFAPAYHRRAVAAVHGGDLAGALVDLDRALELEQGFAAAHLTRAEVLANMGRRDEALESADLACTLTPNQPQPFLVRAELHAARGDLARAESDADHAVRIAPDLLGPRLARGQYRLSAGDHEEALVDARWVLARRAGHTDALLFLAAVHHRRGELEEAEAIARRIVAADSRVWRGHRLLGWVALARERYAEALGHLETALAIQDSGQLRLARARALAGLGRAGEAREDFTRALRLLPSGPDAEAAKRERAALGEE